MPASPLAALREAPIVPVITLDDPDAMEPLLHALVAGGIRVVEITLRTPAGIGGIRRAAAAGGAVIAAGTVTDPDQVSECADAGAELVISPGLDLDVLSRAQSVGLIAIPGVATATEAQEAMKAGLRVVKFFPAELLGGLEMIDALSAPLAGLEFLASGGINAGNAALYLRHPAVIAVSGSWMAPQASIAAGDFSTIERLSREAVNIARSARR